MRKIKIAFITAAGLNSGGTERFMQTIAANLPQDKYEVDYYYTPPVAQHRFQYMVEHNINLIEYQGTYYRKWRYLFLKETNFWDMYKGGYDLIQLASCGYPDDINSKIKDTPMIDSIHWVAGVCNAYNISRVMHISEFSRDIWLGKGGDKSRIEMISLPLYLPIYEFTDIRESLGLESDRFLFGFHQANRDEIFSDIPLKAYKEIEDDTNAFVICNGSKRYREQAKELGLKNIYFYDYLKDDNEFYSVINSLDVYAHGRFDGELNSAAIAEALSCNLPVITHPSDWFNGHLEIVTGNGFVAKDYREYAKYMKMLQQDKELWQKCSDESKRIFHDKYDFDVQMDRIMEIYTCALDNPYPNKLRRIWFDIIQRIGNTIKRMAVRLFAKDIALK